MSKENVQRRVCCLLITKLVQNCLRIVQLPPLPIYKSNNTTELKLELVCRRLYDA